MGSEKTRVRTILNKIKVVAQNGVNFNFYESWFDLPSEEELEKRESEKQLEKLEMELSERS